MGFFSNFVKDFASGYNNAQGRDNPDAYCWLQFIKNLRNQIL